ncbi:Cytidylyltransferase [Musa troglodytarum]|uniref:Cytidylyltransferase n=1 Tax=Musa troglodytarum TaxID=320322 RepID=A0A9E7HKA2_9LILI|nr:Cytidylyltransferase [Musa troglodytarum]
MDDSWLAKCVAAAAATIAGRCARIGGLSLLFPITIPSFLEDVSLSSAEIPQSGSHSINPGETIWRVERVYHTGASNAKGSEQYVRTPGLFVCIEKGKDTEKIISTNEILQENKNNIFSVDEIVPNQISPARVRDCIRRGLSVKHRTHDEVVDCIKDQKLYINSLAVLLKSMSFSIGSTA